jgi:tetratricopeptide (TPR) repeat protein
LKRYHFLFAFFILAVSCEKTNNINDKTTIENNYYDKAYDFLAKSEKDSAFIYFNLAKNIFSQNNDSVRVGNCLVNMAIIEGEKGDYFGSQETALSAIIYLDENELKLHPIIYSNYNNLGIVANNLKDFKNSLIWYEKALKISDNKQKQTIYNNIAMVNSRSDHYSKALNILKSLQTNLNDSKNINSKTRILDNLAYTKFLQNKNYNAEPKLNKALEIR